MPIYEYECEGCGKIFEIFQKIVDEPLTECESCKGKLNKLISQCSFHLKGTGWYVTDYKKPTDTAGKGAANGGKQAEKAESSADAPAAASSSETPKTESKAEAASSSVAG